MLSWLWKSGQHNKKKKSSLQNQTRALISHMLLMFPSFLMQEKKKISTAHRKRGLFSFSQNWDLNFGAWFAKADVCQLTPQYLQSLWAHQILKGCALKMHEVNNSELFLWSFSHWSPLKDPDKRPLTQRALAQTVQFHSICFISLGAHSVIDVEQIEKKVVFFSFLDGSTFFIIGRICQTASTLHL